jgi:hypothetical protein
MTFQTALIFAAHYFRLKAICFAVWVAFNPQAARAPHADAVADAIATAVMFDAAVVVDDEHETALAARYAVEESWLKPRAVGDGGDAHGIFQLHSPVGRGSLQEQTAGWLVLLHDGARTCPAHPAAPLSGGCDRAWKLADRRTRAANEVLDHFEADAPIELVPYAEAPAATEERLPRGGAQNPRL